MKKDKFRTYAAILTIIICIIGIIVNFSDMASRHKSEETDTETLNRADYLFDEKDEFKIWTDPETGVQYIAYDGYGGRFAMTPRLNADGSLCVTEK